MYQINKTRSDLEPVPFGSDNTLHREDILELSEKNADPMGHEQLQEDGFVLVSFAKRSPNSLSPEDFDCLKAYYHRQYASQLEMENKVQKIKRIKVLGHKYGSLLTGRDNAAGICAYRPDDYQNDDLKDVVDTGGEEHLRAGTVEYYFFHEARFYENGEWFPTEHCFAFVSWYKNARVGQEDLATGTSKRNRPFRREYEAKSSYSILPVHKLYTPISLSDSNIKTALVALPLTRVYI